MSWIDFIGMAAGTLTTTAFLPQVVGMWRTKSVKDVSYLMLSIFLTGVSLWTVYGILIRSLPVIAANAVTLTLVLTALILRIRYR